MFIVLTWTLVALIAADVIWWGSGLLEHASERLASYYQLPAIVQGAIIVAVGSSWGWRPLWARRYSISSWCRPCRA